MTSIRRRLLSLLLATLLIAFLLGGLAIYFAALDQVDGLLDFELRQLAISLRDQNRPGGFGPPPENEDQELQFVIQVWGEDGVRVYYSHPHTSLPGLEGLGFATLTTADGQWRVYAVESAGQIIQVAQPLRARNRMALEVASKLLLPLAVVLPLLGGLTWFLVGRGLAPLHRLARAVEGRSPTVLAPIRDIDVPSEALPLVSALNALLERLDEALAAQGAFIADAAHELRTPLAAVRLQAQVLEKAQSDADRQRALTELKRGIDRAAHAVGQLLTLARQEPGVTERPFEPIDLGALLQDIIAAQAGLIAEKHLDLGLASGEASAIVHGDRLGLSILLSNLLSNAIRYTPAGGTIDLAIEVNSIGSVTVSIDDSGPGIPETELDRVFDRFYRVPGTRETGSGLGLAIVRQIAQRHGADVRLSNRPNGGLRAEVCWRAVVSG